MATYVDVVNTVLTRLREPTITSVQDTTYSKLIGLFVNDAKREVEDAYDWNALGATVTLTTVSGTYNYTLTNSKTRFRTIDVLNDTSNFRMQYATTRWMNEQFLLVTPTQGSPYYYNFNGVDSDGDTQVDIFPIPNDVYTVRFNLTIPQDDLSSNATKLLVPSHLVEQLAYSKAITERGEDAGVSSLEAYSIYRNSLADAIAIEANHYPEKVEWMAY
jgi:hypothetical protein